MLVQLNFSSNLGGFTSPFSRSSQNAIENPDYLVHADAVIRNISTTFSGLYRQDRERAEASKKFFDILLGRRSTTQQTDRFKSVL